MIKLVALDLDGTLTQHKSALEPAGRAVLDELAEKFKPVMVCAGGCARVYNQMGRYPIDIIGYYGMQISTVENGTLKITKEFAVNTDREEAIARAEAIRLEFGLTEYDGDSMEFHASGMLTFPLLGTAAPLAKKLAYDPKRQKRRQYYQKVRDEFSDYNVFIGGSSSFDLVPKPFSKLYAIECYMNRQGIKRNETVYIGDDYGEGGNDCGIYNSDIAFICIDDYRDFPKTVREELLYYDGN